MTTEHERAAAEPPADQDQGRHLLDPQAGRQVEIIYALPPALAAADTPDELSLDDMMLAVWRNRWRLLLPACLLAALAVGWAMTKPDVYRYQLALEIGSTSLGGGPVEPPSDLVQKITEAYVPNIKEAFLDAGSLTQELVVYVENWAPTIDNGKDTQIISIGCRASDAEGALAGEMLQALEEKIAADHNRILDVSRRSLELAINDKKRGLANLVDQEQIIRGRNQALDDEQQLVTVRLEALAASIEQARANRRQALDEITGQAQALTLMMIDSGIQSDQDQQANYQQRLTIDLPLERASLAKSLSDLQRTRTSIEAEIGSIEQQLARFRNTRAIVPITRGTKKEGPKRAFMVIGGGFLGGCVGILWAMVAGLRRRVLLAAKQQRRAGVCDQ